MFWILAMDSYELTGQKLCQVFNSRSGCMCDMHSVCYEAKLPSLKMKTQPKQLAALNVRLNKGKTLQLIYPMTQNKKVLTQLTQVRFSPSSHMNRERLCPELTTGANVIKLFTAVSQDFS